MHNKRGHVGQTVFKKGKNIRILNYKLDAALNFSPE